MKMSFLKSKILLLNKVSTIIVLIGILVFDFIIFNKVYSYYNACYIMEIRGKYYCVKNRYHNSPLLKGLIEIDGETYYFGDDSVMVIDKTIEIDGEKYIFGSDGKMVK